MNETEDEHKKAELFSAMPKISVDYAITEKMNPKDVYIIRGDFGWSDIGTWNIIQEKLKGDDEGNVFKGDITEIDSHNNLIYGIDKKKIATIGLNDMIVIDTEDALLICPKGRSEDLKKILKKIEEDGGETYL